MAEIRIEGRRLNDKGMTASGHMYLVYRDDNGDEFVINGTGNGGLIN